MSTWRWSDLNAHNRLPEEIIEPLINVPTTANDGANRDPVIPKPIKRKPVPSLSPVSPSFSALSNTRHSPYKTKQIYARIADEEVRTVTDTEERNGTSYEAYRPNGNSGGDLRAHQLLCKWLPYTLRWPYLLALLLFSLAILGVVVSLHIDSRRFHGLADDDDKSIQFFGWRFVPTLVAVLYALSCTMLLEDVKRTEPFSRLAKLGGADTASTVLQPPGAWWNAFVDGFSLRKNQGSRSWVLVFSSVCMILASLIISPLSSAFLVSDEVTISTNSSFKRILPSQQAPLTFGDQIIPRFRTIAHLLQGVTTSAWVMDNATVLPFYPPQYPTTPLDAIIGTVPETWQAETTVLTATLDCKPLQFVSKALQNISYQQTVDNNTFTGFYTVRSINLTTEDGCLVGFAPPVTSYFLTLGGASWAPPGTLTVSVNDIITQDGLLLNYSDDHMIFSFSEQCSADELLVISNPWVLLNSTSYGITDDTPWNPDLQIGGQVCKANYQAANVTVNINVTSSETLVTYDEQAFRENQLPIDPTIIDINKFQQDFLSPNWSYHLYPPTDILDSRPIFGGPAAMLLAMYEFSTTNAMTDSSLVVQATQLKQRYLGEAVVAALSQTTNDMNTTLDGQQMSIQRRIIVVESIAIALEITIFIEIVLIVGLYWLTRLSKRKLQLSSDPARAITLARLIAQDSETRRAFLRRHTTELDTIKKNLENVRLTMSPNRLSANEIRHLRQTSHEKDTEKEDRPSRPRDWRPTILYRRTATGLTLLLVIVLSAIAVLLRYSQGPGLYEQAFTYSTQVVVSGKRISSIAPYSIIPTLIAVIIGLWWGAFETALRFLQPFIAMTRRPATFQNGVSLSYQSSYQLWAGVKAALRGHWLLSAVCTGAFLSQILTIGMSALWQEEYGYHNSTVNMQRHLELRVMPTSIPSEYIPGTHAVTGADTAVAALAKLYTSLQTNWLYSAIIQTTLNGSQPGWSLDGWSFVPVDLSQLNEPMTGTQDVNVTVATFAIRGQLECSPWGALNNLSNWVMPQDFTNGSYWNVTANPAGLREGYTLGCGGVSGNMIVEMNRTANYTCDYDAYTTFFNQQVGLTCCENYTAQGSRDNAAIAYWSLTNDELTQPYNFTVKWIYGKPIAGVQLNGSTNAYLAWPEVPQMAALNCMPVIQKANASVTVNQRTEAVYSYSILDDIQDDTYAWIDDFNSNVGDTVESGEYPDNITTSHGILFTRALLASADLANLVGDADNTDWIDPSKPGAIESLQDLTFNFRQPGVNMDYMSYSMYSSANKNATALLDPSNLAYYANKTFATFFQHFVSTNVSYTDGGYGYQPIGFKLPANNTSPAVANLTSVPVTEPTVQAQISTRVKVLHMSPVAAWLCMSILLWLIITALLYAILEKRYLATMKHGVDTIADVLFLVAGSTAFLNHIRQHGTSNVQAAGLETKLGWFRDQDGHERWGIELVGEEHGVEWLDGEYGQAGRRGENRGRDEGAVESIPMVAKTRHVVDTREEELEVSPDINRMRYS